jgi:hypothetical protein
MFSTLARLWSWLKENDASNWFVIFFSLFAWPFFLKWWYARKRQSIPHLEVFPSPDPSGLTIDGKQFDAVRFIFTNRTGAVVYLYHVELRETRRFPIPVEASRDISAGWRNLKFGVVAHSSGTVQVQYGSHECILQTNQSAITVMALSTKIDGDIYSYRPLWFRRFLSWPKYYRLRYTAMVGDKKYSVETIY